MGHPEELVDSYSEVVDRRNLQPCLGRLTGCTGQRVYTVYLDQLEMEELVY